jgi:predicted nucleic acid-binding protein
MPAADASVGEVMSYVFGPPFQMPQTDSKVASFQPALHRSISVMHVRNSDNPINFPDRRGIFPGTLLAEVPPIVVDANWLRNDIKYACRNGQRTTLTNVANEGLLRLFCSQHVIDEVGEHAAEWTNGSEVSLESFLRRWLMEYLPLLRVLQDNDVSRELLTPDEVGRIEKLRVVDPDDVPSATLALALGAFYLSDDKRALRAVYGPGVDLWRHGELLDLLMAGGDAGELGQMLQLMTGLITGLGTFAAQSAWRRIGPVGLFLVAALGYAGYRRMSTETRAKIGKGVTTGLTAFAEAYAEWQVHLRRFRRASPVLPSWGELATKNDPTFVLTRACLFSLARVGQSNCSAAELKIRLPELSVAQGEARVRQVLRTAPCFFEAWYGRWQVGEMAVPVGQLLALKPAEAS